MTKRAKKEERPVPGKPEEIDPGERVLAWVKARRRSLTVAAVVVAVVGGGVWFTTTAQRRREAFARRELSQARLAAESGNLALATNDLSRLIGTYGGSRAAQEAALVLAQVRLLQNQAELAIVDLERFIAVGPDDDYQVQAHQLLGAALEQTSRFAAAGEAYLAGANSPGFDFLRSELLLDAGRAFVLARDTARAVAAYERVLTEFEDPPGATEARLRLAELSRFDIAG